MDRANGPRGRVAFESVLGNAISSMNGSIVAEGDEFIQGPSVQRTPNWRSQHLNNLHPCVNPVFKEYLPRIIFYQQQRYSHYRLKRTA